LFLNRFIVFALFDSPTYGVIMPHSEAFGNPDVVCTRMALDQHRHRDCARVAFAEGLPPLFTVRHLPATPSGLYNLRP